MSLSCEEFLVFWGLSLGSTTMYTRFHSSGSVSSSLPVSVLPSFEPRTYKHGGYPVGTESGECNQRDPYLSNSVIIFPTLSSSLIFFLTLVSHVLSYLTIVHHFIKINKDNIDDISGNSQHLLSANSMQGVSVNILQVVCHQIATMLARGPIIITPILQSSSRGTEW